MAANALGPALAELGHGDHLVAVLQGVPPHHLGAAQAPDPHLDQTQDVRHVGHVPERVGVGHGRPMDERHVVQMGVEMDDVQRLGEGTDHGEGDGVVATQDDGRAHLGSAPGR